MNGITLGVFVSHFVSSAASTVGRLPTFCRFVLNEATGALVAAGPEATGDAVIVTAIIGARSAAGLGAPPSVLPTAASPTRTVLRITGAGATGVPSGALVVRSWADLPPPCGWIPAPESLARPTPPVHVSPADFAGFDVAVRRVLGDAAARRAGIPVPWPAVGVGAAVSGPPLVAGASLPVATLARSPSGLYRLPVSVGGWLEAALVRAAFAAGVAPPGWAPVAPVPPAAVRSRPPPWRGGGNPRCLEEGGATTVTPMLEDTRARRGGVGGGKGTNRKPPAGPRRPRTRNAVADEPDRASRRWAQQQRNRVAAARANDKLRARRAAEKAAAAQAASLPQMEPAADVVFTTAAEVAGQLTEAAGSVAGEQGKGGGGGIGEIDGRG